MPPWLLAYPSWGWHPHTLHFCCAALQGRMRRLLADLGDPHHSWPAAVHVAGTKGKGSTVTMLAAILQAAGYKAGAYTRWGGAAAEWCTAGHHAGKGCS